MLRVAMHIWYNIQLEIKCYWGRNTVQLQATGIQALKLRMQSLL